MSYYTETNPVHQLTKVQERRIEVLVDNYRWQCKVNMDDDNAFDEIYIEADELAEELGIHRDDFWFTFFA